jgi:hypothetical protein
LIDNRQRVGPEGIAGPRPLGDHPLRATAVVQELTGYTEPQALQLIAIETGVSKGDVGQEELKPSLDPVAALP